MSKGAMEAGSAKEQRVEDDLWLLALAPMVQGIAEGDIQIWGGVVILIGVRRLWRHANWLWEDWKVGRSKRRPSGP